MINKRLVAYLKDSKKYIYLQVFFKWIILLAQFNIVYELGYLLDNIVVSKTIDSTLLLQSCIQILIMIVVRYIMQKLVSNTSYQASKQVKLTLRQEIFNKCLQLNRQYTAYIETSKLVQLAVEGVDQLETYFGRYLPQFFYSLLAPLTLFVLLVRVNFKVSLILLICVPIIPMAIVAVQKFAKKLLSKYWGMYGNLGDRFLDNIQGLTTLKIYQSDDLKHKEMNEEAERFRKMTMRVLIMQLNSISIMDLVAFGGAAIGIVVSLQDYMVGKMTLQATFMMVMLSAEFFIPLRLLGSFFHIAMNGNAASQDIFNFLDIEVDQTPKVNITDTSASIEVSHVNFAYVEGKDVLHDVSLSIKEKGLYSIVGISGSGKSTLASLLKGEHLDYRGMIKLYDHDLQQINHRSLMEHMTLIEHTPYLFKGSIYATLKDASNKATIQQMDEALKKVNLYDFVYENGGLEKEISERGANLSGGQAQRLNLARALLHDTPIYIFDEATSNIDVESENTILQVIHELAKDHLVLMISHRMASVENSKEIYVLDQGKLIGQGSHEQLMKECDVYKNMVLKQKEIEGGA